MSIEVVHKRVPHSVFERAAAERFGDMAKVVVDVRRRIMAIGGDLHADEETLLLDDGSRHADLWGINLYPATLGDDWMEYDSMNNVRRSQGNRSRGDENPTLREAIRTVVGELWRDRQEPPFRARRSTLVDHGHLRAARERGQRGRTHLGGA